MNATVIASAMAQQQVAGAVATGKPAPVEHTPGPCPPAAESIAACIELKLIADNGDGTFRALMHGRTGPDDDGRIQ